MIFTVFFLAVHIATPLRAIETPPVDELEVMLKKIENNLRVANEILIDDFYCVLFGCTYCYTSESY